VTDLLDEFSARSSGYVWQVQLLKKIQKLVAGRAEKIVVASHYLKRIIGNWGVSTDKIRVIYNAFAVPKIPTVVPASQKPILVSVGRLVPWKGFSTLIDLMPRLLILEPDLELLIIGDGPDQRTLQTQIDQAQLTKQVKLLGRLDTETLFAYLSQATVFVLNTSYEGFSHQLLEVMAIGLPVVTTEVGGNPELITDQVTGLLVPYDDKEALSSAISHLLSQPKLRESLALAAKAKVAEFSKTRMLSEVVSLFQTHENL
jgi:glycosyltransferase involved in cell wall biosynthesis